MAKLRFYSIYSPLRLHTLISSVFLFLYNLRTWNAGSQATTFPTLLRLDAFKQPFILLNFYCRQKNADVKNIYYCHLTFAQKKKQKCTLSLMYESTLPHEHIYTWQQVINHSLHRMLLTHKCMIYNSILNTSINNRLVHL